MQLRRAQYLNHLRRQQMLLQQQRGQKQQGERVALRQPTGSPLLQEKPTLTEYQRNLQRRQRLIQRRLELKESKKRRENLAKSLFPGPSTEFAGAMTDAESVTEEAVAAAPFLFRSGSAEARRLAEKPPR